VKINAESIELGEAVIVLAELYEEKKKARIYIDGELSNSTSPYLAERNILVS